MAASRLLTSLSLILAATTAFAQDAPVTTGSLPPPAVLAPPPSVDPIGDLIRADDTPPPVGAAPATVAPPFPGPTLGTPPAGAFTVAPLLPAAAEVVSTPIVPADFLTAANAVAFADRLATGDAPDPMITRLQVMLDRVDASPGVIDGLMGENVRKAVAAFETMRGLPADGALDADMWSTLESLTPEPVLVIHLLTPDDVAAPVYADLPTDYAELAGYDRLAYRSIVEALAERFHMDEDLLRALNPNAAFTAGEEIIVADVGSAAETDVARLVADKATAQLLGFDAAGALVVAYPATIGSDDLPSPSGVHAVSNVATDAEYWYRPAVNFQQGENTEALRLAPGPNNPIGTTWIGLDAPTYGIHGTPEPSAIDKTSSHGCVRLTNWDVEELVHLVAMGVPVEFIDGSAVAAGE